MADYFFFFEPASLLLRCCSFVWITLHHKLKSVVVKRGRGQAQTSFRKLNLAPQAEQRRGRLNEQLNHGSTRIQLMSTMCASVTMGKVRQSLVAMG